jgi:hypothetical protein
VGEVLTVTRTDGAQRASSRVAVDKARTAATLVRPSREIEEQVSAGRYGALALHGAGALTGGTARRRRRGGRWRRHERREARREDEACSIAGAANGLKGDVTGDVWICGPGGLWVVAADGTLLGRLELPEPPHNLAWGDADGRTPHVTALTSVYRLRTTVEGIRP